MITVFASTMISLRNAGIEGTALTLAESQMEATRPSRTPTSGLDTADGPRPAAIPYNTANSPTRRCRRRAVSPAASRSRRSVHGTHPAGRRVCRADVNGPDGRQYRIDTYVKTSGTLKSVTVVARIYENGAVGRIKARASTAFDPATTTHNF